LDPDATVAGVVRAWAQRRRQPARLAVIAATVPELVDKLRGVSLGEHPAATDRGLASEAPRIAFLYPGQGAQRLGMLSDIRQRFPMARGAMAEVEASLDGELPVPLTHLLYPEARAEAVPEETAMAQLTDTENCQPALLTCGIALTRILESVGVRPHVVTGHSLGEFTAASVAGVLPPDEAARFVARRGQAMADLPGDHGAMAAIMADEETASALLADGAVIANVNHPRQVVISGATEAVEHTVANAKAAAVKAKQLQVSHGFHSPVLAELDCEPLLDGLHFSDPRVPVASGIDPEPYRDATHARDVFRRHATSPVRFTRALEQCRQAGADLYLQVGAGGPLASFARGALPRDHRGVLSLASTDDHDQGVSFLKTLARLWVEGVDIDSSVIAAPAPLASVPPVVLPRQVYWAVKDEPQLGLNLEGVSQRTAPAAPAPHKAAPTPAPQADQGPRDVATEVIRVVAKVSAYPAGALKPGMALVEDLGFDSLMVGDLATGLADAFPGLGGIPQELLINRPTVQDLIDYVSTAGRDAEEEADDDAPLAAWRPVWREAPLPNLPSRTAENRIVLVTREVGAPPGTDLATSLADAFAAAGHQARVVTEEEAAGAEAAHLIVHCGAWSEPVPVRAVLDGECDWPDRATDLIRVLDRQADLGASPDLFAVVRDGDVWAEAVAGVVRSVAREWPGVVAKSIALAEVPEGLGAMLLSEWTSADRTVDVCYRGGTRLALALERVEESPDGWTPTAVDTIVVTGGARGIGAALGAQLAASGARVLLLDPGDPSPEASQTIAAHEGRVEHLRADVTDRTALHEALRSRGPITALVHCAGVLADGPLGQVDPARGQLARAVKVGGWLNALAACGEDLKVALGISSWAGRFGNRHQAHYAAANALLSGLAEHAPEGTRAVVGEFGPWTSSEMVRTIPAPVQAAMRAEGVDFVGDTAGMDALVGDLRGHTGALVHGRDLPETTRAARFEEVLSVETHPFLLDHAIDGTPILPLAAAIDRLAQVADADAPYQIEDLRLFAGITVKEPVRLVASARGERTELRIGDRETLAYRARVRSQVPTPPADPGPTRGGAAPSLSLREFYDGVTFHGPLLQGIVAIDGVGDAFVRGRVRTGRPSDWVPGTPRERFTADPLVVDSAMQLSAYVAWTRFGRAGTPVGVGRYVQLAPLPDGEVVAEVTFGEQEADRFTGTLWIRDEKGRLLAKAEDVVAELRAVQGEEPPFEAKPEWVDPSVWPEVQDLKLRLDGADAMGIRNPYFAVHEGTARNVTTVGGRELVNFSSYNYLGLSGDPRVLQAVKEAIDQYGTSVSASRVASGERPFHGELEAELAACQGAEDALVYTAGHATNVTTIGHLLGPEDLILHDELIHDSALQGIKLSGSARRQFRHDDPEDLEQQLEELRRHYQRVLIAVEGVYSMDGDICQLPAYLDLKERYGCMLFVDEAHSFGVVGPNGKGAGDHWGIDGSRVDLWMGTLSKSLASCGGWIAGSEPLITYLRYTAPGFVYSAGITPANGVAALTSLRLMLAEPERVATLQSNARLFHDGLVARGIDTGPAHGESGVVPGVTGNSMHALMLSQRLEDQGINVQPIMYPAVADDAARLRFFLSSTHTPAQLEWTVDRVADTLAEVRAEFEI
jgi:8-amino-7-oxononanoate synthase